ncbi:MAG: hypothetical protein KIH08_05250 [Candidatus Freyarchaeota archaeon]|nr:hypothetical protein [Candidatus Jordarchaeia archaeon]MBS7268971.1 hypothetical protein [Candidatus Jordarchaeia archaeon]MBS7279996.1 hypothetical protein [Candidatus Jordarchaeia archaeon]
MDSVESLIKYLEKELDWCLDEVKVCEVRVGLEYVGVMLSSGEAGLAHVLREDSPECEVFDKAGELQGSSARDMMNLATSRNLISAAIGVATINALSQIAFKSKPDLYPFTNADVLDLVLPNDRILMVGYFAPVIPKLMEKTREITVIEKRNVPSPMVKVAGEEQLEELSMDKDIAIITGSTLVNRTIDKILKHCKGMREAALVGPTASFTPQPLFERGVTAVMGVKIFNPQKMLEVISQGGGTRKLLQTCAQKTAILKKHMKL